MPLEEGFIGGQASSEQQRIASQAQRLREQYMADPYDYKSAARAQEGMVGKTFGAVGYGMQEGVENIINMPFDLMGQADKDRWDITWLEPRQGLGYDVLSGITQFVTGLPVGGPMAKGATKLTSMGMKALRGADKLKRAQRTRQIAGKFKEGQRLTPIQSLKKGLKDGLLTGYMADFAAFNGDQSMLMGFFQSHPELKQSYDEITSEAGWEHRSAEDLAADTTSRLNRAARNLTGRGIFAVEGAVLGAFFNVFWQSMKLLRYRDGVLKETALGRSGKSAKGAARTEKKGETFLKDQETLKEKTEALGFAEQGEQVRLDRPDAEKITDPDALERVAREEDELSKKVSEMEEVLDGADGKKDDFASRADEETLVPHEWDDMAVDNVGGVKKTVWPKKTIHHDRSYNPVFREMVGDDVITTINKGPNAAEVHFNRGRIGEIWESGGDMLPSQPGVKGGKQVPREAFASAFEYESWLLARHAAELKFPKARGESAKGYQQRLDIHAANALKRRGIGNLWKYEFDAIPGMEHLKVADDLMNEKLFKGGTADATGIVQQLAKAAKGEGVNMDALLMQAMKVINVDGTMTDAGQKYFTARLMHFFMNNMRKTFSDPKNDQIAKAIGWLGDPNKQTATDFLMKDVFNQVDNIATANGMEPRMVMERFRKGYGDYKGLYSEIKVPEKPIEQAIKEDVKVMKELYIRTWAYRIDQAVSMKEFAEVNSQLAKGGASDEVYVKFVRGMKKLEAKLSSFTQLRTSTGRTLAAHKALDVEGLFGTKPADAMRLREEIINRGGGKQGLDNLANSLEAIIDGSKREIDGEIGESGFVGVKDFLNKQITGIDRHNEYWLNAILSGTKTQVVNTIGTAMHMAWKPIEGVMGSVGNPKSRQYFIQQTMYAALITGETVKLMMALGLNKGGKLLHIIGEKGYHANRANIFGRGTQGAGALAGGRKAFRSGKSILESRSTLFDVSPTKAITGDWLNDGIANSEFLGAPVGRWAKGTLDWLGDQIRLPSRFMISTDELFKQVAYRSSAMARLTGDAVEKLGEGASKVDISNYVATRFQGMIRRSGARYTPDILKDEAFANYAQAIRHANESGEALPSEFGKRDDYIKKYIDDKYDSKRSTLSDYSMEHAEDVTFTRGLDADYNVLMAEGKLNKGSWAFQKDMQDMVGRHSWMRLLMPFVRTPVNLLKFPLQRLPLVPTKAMVDKRAGGLLKRYHMRYQADMLSGDAIKAAEAKGRVITGYFLYGGLIAAATSGLVTGQGPTNVRERRQLMATGWRPYSIRIGGKYISYQRLDPFSSILGLSADMTEYLNEAHEEGDINDNWIKALFLGGGYSISNNIINKSYLSGLTNILQALVNPTGEGDYLTRLLEKQATAYIPKAVSQFTPLTDDNLIKDTYGLIDALQARTPFANKHLEPKRGLLGQALEGMDADLLARSASLVNPFPYSTIKNDEVLDNLAALQYGFTPPKPRLQNDNHLDMRKFKDDAGRSAYDWFQERVGTTKIGGKTLKEALLKLFRGKWYLAATALSGTDEWERGSDDPRVQRARALVQRYRSKAQTDTRKRFPKLHYAILARRNTMRKNRTFNR
jgi:hypothetical protein